MGPVPYFGATRSLGRSIHLHAGKIRARVGIAFNGALFELILPVASGIISTFVDRARAMKQVPVRDWSDR